MDLQLDGKVVVITGAGAGIGLATAEAFVAEGAKVVAGDINPAALDKIKGRGRITPFKVDLLSPGGAQTLVDAALREHGTIDALVNNLGGPMKHTSFLDLSDQDWQATIALNFLGMIRACRAALPIMVGKGKGAIVSVASDAGRQPDPIFTDYSACKAAVMNLGKSLSIEFGPKGVRSNTIAPGPIRTPGLVDNFATKVAPGWGMSTDEAIDHFAKNIRRIPLGKLGEPADIAAVVLFLASDRAKNVNGSCYGADGGSYYGL